MILLKHKELESIGDLREALQTAIELEHATIPPYLTARFTLFETGNDAISDIIGSVLNEEMLHLSIACNVLNAIGGNPVLNKPGFIPSYPGPLPGGVETGLIVPIEKFSKELVKNVFMMIEEPEHPIQIKSLTAKEGVTIGMFYTQIKKIISELEKEAKSKGKTIFTGKVSEQMTYERFYPSELLFPITDKKSAFKAIDIIIDQGEGTTTDPFVDADADGGHDEPAHYYRFQEIVKGLTLQKKPKGGYVYGKPEIPFKPKLVPNMRPNPKMSDYPENTQAYVNSKLFNANYTALLNCLHETFNGHPEKINDAMGIMFSLRLYALKLLAIPDPNDPKYVCGPSYEFVLAD